jgi:alpha-glucosidase
MFLLHPSVEPWLVRDDAGLCVTVFTNLSDGVTLLARVEPDNETRYVPLSYAGRLGRLYRFEAHLPWDPSNDPTVYCFKAIHGGHQTWLAADGLHEFLPTRDVHFRVARHHRPPTWVKDQVVYQVFPDRFAQGDPSLAVRTDEYPYGDGRWRVVKKAWGEPIDLSLPETAFYGGDLVGLRGHLDHLVALGVTTLYLTPIFSSGSNHRYDTEDHFNVDQHLGGNAALLALGEAMRERDLKLVLDVTINHTSDNHPWMNRYGRHAKPGAWQSKDSPYRGYYSFRGSGEYAGWNGHASLPVLDLANPALRQVLFEGPQALLRHWLRPPYRIDGWRFDVMHMLGEGPGAGNNAALVRGLRRAVKEENAQAWVLGEHFNEATRWLQGDQEDSAMNYFGFAQPVRAWLARQDISYHPIRLGAWECEAWLTSARARIPYENQLAQLNLLDSHDTARFFTLLGADLPLMKVAVALLFTYPGVPSVYYGDETGLEGGRDPDCRRCFSWDRGQWNEELLLWYRTLAALRRGRAELRQGAYQTLAATASVLSFARTTAAQGTVVVVNSAEAATVTLPVWQLPLEVPSWTSVGSGARLVADAAGGITLSVPAQSVVILTGHAA